MHLNSSDFGASFVESLVST